MSHLPPSLYSSLAKLLLVDFSDEHLFVNVYFYTKPSFLVHAQKMILTVLFGKYLTHDIARSQDLGMHGGHTSAHRPNIEARNRKIAAKNYVHQETTYW